MAQQAKVDGHIQTLVILAVYDSLVFNHSIMRHQGAAVVSVRLTPSLATDD